MQKVWKATLHVQSRPFPEFNTWAPLSMVASRASTNAYGIQVSPWAFRAGNCAKDYFVQPVANHRRHLASSVSSPAATTVPSDFTPTV